MPKYFRLGLQAKVLLVVLGTALLTSGMFAFGINSVLKDKFDIYLDQSLKQRNQRVVEVIEELYGQYRDWGLVADRLDSIAPTVNTVVRVKDNQGRTVLDSSAGRMHSWMMRQGMMGQTGGGPGMMRRWDTYWEKLRGIDDDEIVSFPLAYQGRPIGTAEIVPVGAQGRWTEEDLEFKRTIQTAVVYASAAAGFLALLLSITFAARLTRPVLEITQVAKELGGGNLAARAKVGRRDELGTLAATFNSMARRLEQVDQMRRKFTADVAHELRTPVTTIKSYIEGFQDGILRPDADRLQELEEETLRLSELITDLQDLTLIESDNLILDKTQFDLAREVSSQIRRLAPLFQEKRIALEDDTGESAQITGDRKLLMRAVGNLVNNALKYTGNGGMVTVAVASLPDRVEVRVQDTGIGIPEEDLPYVFDRFYRADPSRSRKTGGSGIGLSLVKEIAEAHGGQVRVESKVGQGSEFILELPQ